MTLTVPKIGNQYSLQIPAHKFRQGGRSVFSFALDLPTLDGLLPQRIDEDVVRDVNRRLTPSHAKNIQRYLMGDNSDWLLGALLLGIAPDAVEFHPYPDQDGEPSQNIGELRILTERKNTMKIFDGQHRRRAIADALSELDDDVRRADKLADLKRASVPVVLYVEENIRALRQMFADASKTKPIEGNTVTRFDERDAFNVTAMRMSENSSLFGGRVEMERTTVRRASECLVAINQLAADLKTLAVGYSGRVSKERNDDLMLELDELYERCQTWADDFMPAAREEYDDLIAGEIDNTDIPKMRPNTFAYNAAVIRIFAGCYYEWSKNNSDWKPLAEFIRKASLQPGETGEDALLVKAGVVAPGSHTPLPRAQEMKRAIEYITNEAQRSSTQSILELEG